MSRGLFPVMSFPSTLKNYQDYRLAYISDEYINASNYFLLKLPLFLRVLLDMNFCTLWQIKSILLERHCIFLFSSCFSSQAKSLNHSTGAGSGENDMFLSKQHLQVLSAQWMRESRFGSPQFACLGMRVSHDSRARFIRIPNSQQHSVLCGISVNKQGMGRIKESPNLGFISQNPASPTGS